MGALFSAPGRVRALATASGASFGIYLTHMVFFYYAGALTGLDGSRLLWRTVMPFEAYAVCLVGTLVMKRIRACGPLCRKGFGLGLTRSSSIVWFSGLFACKIIESFY